VDRIGVRPETAAAMTGSGAVDGSTAALRARAGHARPADIAGERLDDVRVSLATDVPPGERTHDTAGHHAETSSDPRHAPHSDAGDERRHAGPNGRGAAAASPFARADLPLGHERGARIAAVYEAEALSSLIYRMGGAPRPSAKGTYVDVRV